MFITLSLLLAVACLAPGAAKLLGHPKMRASARHFDIPWARYRLIGVAEVAAAAGVLAGLGWRPVGLLASVAMALLLIGALVTHRRAHDGPKDAAAAIVALAICLSYLAVALNR